MQWYLSQVKQLYSKFEVFSIKQVPKSKNAHDDLLATLATSLREGLLRVIMVEDLAARSLLEKTQYMLAELDRPSGVIPKGWNTAQRQDQGRKGSEKSTMVLALKRIEAIQTIVLEAILAVCSSQGSGGIAGKVP